MKRKNRDAHITFLLTREQWLGVAILAVLAACVFIALRFFHKPQEVIDVVVTDSTKTAFAAHQARQDSLHKAQWRRQHPRDTIAIVLQPFDPNTADSSTLVHLGLKPWQARNMLKYRAKGGRYRKAEDMKKLYGMTDSLYTVLEPYIQITVDTTKANEAQPDSVQQDSIPLYISTKRDTILNLRTADTTELKMIRGIGSYTAREIVRYRTRLGGYTHTRQLLDIKAVNRAIALRMEHDSTYTTDSLLCHFYIDSIVVNTLSVNHLRTEQLQRHPYLSFTQAKAIYELRRRRIHIDSPEQLQSLDCFTPEELERVLPYLSFKR